MRRLAILLLLFASPAAAGELGVYACRSTAPDVSHFNVYADGGLVVSVPVAELEPLLEPADCNLDGTPTTDQSDLMHGKSFTAPDGCASRLYFARFAIGSLESGDSPSVGSIARPSVFEVVVGTSGIRSVNGHNFTATAEVRKLDGSVIPSTFVGCGQIDIQDTATRTIVVDTGLLPAVFTIEIEAPTGLVVR